MDELNLSQILKSLSSPSRLRIFKILMEGIQCNCEIAERMQMSLSLVSHHLRILREADLVTAERDTQDARWIYYEINREMLTDLKYSLSNLLDINHIKPRVPDCGPAICRDC